MSRCRWACAISRCPSSRWCPDTSGTAAAIRSRVSTRRLPARATRDSIGVKWTVHDDNDDQMVYSVYYRGDGETRWLLLKDNLTDKFYSFDASLLPDGGYTVEVVASDAPSHSPGQALTSTRDSARFEVDTTPPRIEELKAAVEGDADSCEPSAPSTDFPTSSAPNIPSMPATGNTSSRWASCRIQKPRVMTSRWRCLRAGIRHCRTRRKCPPSTWSWCGSTTASTT